MQRGESSVGSMETKQGFALLVKEEVIPPAEIHEKMKSLLGEFKEKVHDEFSEGLPPLRDIQHHGPSILHGFEDPFMQKKVLEMKALNSSSSYHLLLARERNVFYPVCQVSSLIALWKIFMEANL